MVLEKMLHPGGRSAAASLAHREQLLVEALLHRKALRGEVLAQGGAEAARAAEPEAGVAPTRRQLADPRASEPAVAGVDEDVQPDAGGLGRLSNLMSGLSVLRWSGVRVVPVDVDAV